MALKFRRGTTAQKSGSLAFGEPYVNTTLGTLQIGLDTGDVTLASSNGLISGSSQLTSSYDGRYETQGRGIISSSAQIDTLFNIDGLISGSSQITYSEISSIPAGIVSGSAQVTPLLPNGVVSGSSQINATATTNWSTGIKTELNSNTVVSGSSQITLASTTGFTSYSSSVDSRITTEKGRVDAILSAADADKDSFAEIVTLINSVDTTNDSAFASFYTSSVNRLNNLESTSASVNVSISNINSYTASNDSTNTTQNTRLTALEASASTALSTNNTQATSITNLNSTTASLLVETANLETFSASALTRLSNLEGTDISITLTGDVTGTGTITNLGNVSFATTIEANSVALGTDTTGNYMSNVSAGNAGIVISHTQAEGSTATISLVSGVVSGSSQIDVASTTGDIALGTRTSGNYVATITAGTGVSSTGATTGEGIAHTISIGQAVGTSDNVRFGSIGVGMAASGTSGRIDAANDIVAYSSSDRNFKENITPIENPIEKIRKISGNTYDWKAELKDVHGYEGNDVGVIAQEIEEVLPQIVTTRDNGYKAVKYEKLVALLIEGIKEQQLQIEKLQLEVIDLKKQKGL